jgi:SNF2 family DNA or RNA helicase
VVHLEPKADFQLSEDARDDQLAVTIRFRYGDHKIPPHQHDDDLLYQIASGAESVLLYRNLKFEKETLEKFLSQGFRRVAIDRFETGGEAALDFVADRLPPLHEEGEVFGEAELKQFRILSRFGKGDLKAEVVTYGLDWFSLDLKFVVEGQEIPFEVVRKLVSEGQRYLPLPGKGFVQLKTDEIKTLEETFTELEAEGESHGALQFKSFHAPFLEEILSIDWKAEKGFQEAVRSLRQLSGIPSQELPPGLQEILRPYQHHGYDWLRFLHEHHFHGILADDMGLGKTLQALAFLQDLKNRHGSRPCLVLAPTSVVFNWAAEARKFTPNLTVLQLTGAERKESYDRIAETDLILTSYAIYRRDAEILKKITWRTVILDEAQYIKNYRSKTAGLVKELQAEQRLALTGTPMENRLSELWSIFDFLMPGFLGKFLSFHRRYQRPIEESQDAEALERLKKRLHPFVMRRQKEEVAPELPPKTEIDQFCEMEPEQRKLYEQILLSSRKSVLQEVEEKGIERSQFSILTALLRLRQVCCHPSLMGPEFKQKEIESGKFIMFQELIEEILSEKHRIIVFSQFVEMLTLLRGWLDEKKIAYEYLDGRTRKREERIRRFQDDVEIPIFLISLKAGGTGLNLSEADYVIHYDPWWNPAVQDQATDRVHRLGQKQHVFAYKLITKDSVEEKILTLQERKRDLFRGVLTADSKLGKKLSYEDIEYLFS